MKKQDDDNNGSNPSANPTFQEIVEARLSRRTFLGGGLAAAAVFSTSGLGGLLKAVPADAAKASNGPLLGFQAIPVSEVDEVVVLPGFIA